MMTLAKSLAAVVMWLATIPIGIGLFWIACRVGGISFARGWFQEQRKQRKDVTNGTKN